AHARVSAAPVDSDVQAPRPDAYSGAVQAEIQAHARSDADGSPETQGHCWPRNITYTPTTISKAASHSAAARQRLIVGPSASLWRSRSAPLRSQPRIPFWFRQ